MRKIFTSLLLLLSFVVQAERYKVIGYVSGAGAPLSTLSINAKKLTHINYTFIAIVNGEAVSDPSRSSDSMNFTYLNSLRADNKNIKIQASIGGTSWSHKFSEVAASEEGREKFSISVVKLMKKYNLDGIELHWIFKPTGMYENSYNRTDQKNYILLLEKLRQRIDEQSVLDNRTGNKAYLLSTIGSSRRNYLVHAGLDKAQQYVDYISVQAFEYESTIADRTGISKKTIITGHHANLFASKQDRMFQFSVNATLKEYKDFKVHRRKIVMGIPLYGKGWTNAFEEENGLYQYAGAKMTEDISYEKITKVYLYDSDYVRRWDKAAKAYTLYNKENGNFISYEDPRSVRKKTRYVRWHRLAGVSCTDFTQDAATGKLAKTLRQGMRRVRIHF